MSANDRMNLLRSFMELFMKPTRIDGYIDYVDQGKVLYTNAKASCEIDELCRMRSYGDNSRRTVGKRPDRLHLNLGRRDSSVCGRIYDKGLETKSTTFAGQWERLEIEWKGNRVQEVARQLYRRVKNGPRCYVVDIRSRGLPQSRRTVETRSSITL